MMPGIYKVKFSRPNYKDIDSELTIEPANDAAIVAPDSDKWILQELPKPPQPKPRPDNEISPEIRTLLSDARFYFDNLDYELTVKYIYDAFMKGYRLDGNDMNIFESAYRKRRDYLRGRIEQLEKQEFRKTQNLRDVEEHRDKLRQLSEWYRAVKQI
jgi:hypothetical protein